MRSLEKPWSDEDCGGVRGAGDDTWHKSRAGAVGLSPDAVTAIVAVALLCLEDVLMRYKDLVVSLSSPVSEGCSVRVLSPFSTCLTKAAFYQSCWSLIPSGSLLWIRALQLQCCKSEAVTLFSLYPCAYQKAGGMFFVLWGSSGHWCG